MTNKKTLLLILGIVMISSQAFAQRGLGQAIQKKAGQPDTTKKDSAGYNPALPSFPLLILQQPDSNVLDSAEVPLLLRDLSKQPAAATPAAPAAPVVVPLTEEEKVCMIAYKQKRYAQNEAGWIKLGASRIGFQHAQYDQIGKYYPICKNLKDLVLSHNPEAIQTFLEENASCASLSEESKKTIQQRIATAIADAKKPAQEIKNVNLVEGSNLVVILNKAAMKIHRMAVRDVQFGPEGIPQENYVLSSLKPLVAGISYLNQTSPQDLTCWDKVATKTEANVGKNGGAMLVDLRCGEGEGLTACRTGIDQNIFVQHCDENGVETKCEWTKASNIQSGSTDKIYSDAIENMPIRSRTVDALPSGATVYSLSTEITGAYYLWNKDLVGDRSPILVQARGTVR
jgi:hypothetical protein